KSYRINASQGLIKRYLFMVLQQLELRGNNSMGFLERIRYTSRELRAGESLRVDTGCLVALTQGVEYDIEYVGNVKSAVFGGEGFFFVSLRGPGHVWLQSLPFSRLAGRIWSAAPQAGGQSVGEGSVLGNISTLFEK
ncbi:MAG: AIM24 family protein, partial [Candidatus Electrothrix sp. LOE1_4_5]|nr:AIM24 family protein [Candidatus Electrothrix gigas]